MSFIKEKIILLEKFEPIYFYLFLLVNLIPVFSHQFFPTVDGPAHLYNSKMLVDLLNNPNSPISTFLTFNSSINPNWTGHFLLSFFLFFLPAFVAEKIVLLIYLVGLPLSIRYVFKTTPIKNYYLLYAIFPFTYSYLFYYGFYNFNIALVFLFFGIGVWMKYHKQLTFSRVVLLTAITTMMCLSHLFVFAAFLIIILIYNFKDLDLTGHNIKIDQKSLKNYLFQFLSILIGLIIAIHFILSNHFARTPLLYLAFHDIFISLKYVMPAKGVNYDGYSQLTRILLYVFATLFAYLTIVTSHDLWKYKRLVLTNKIWFFICSIVLLLIFTLPDYIGPSIGLVSARLMLLFFILLIIGLAAQNVALWLKAILFVTINFVNYSILIHNHRSVEEGCQLAKEINAASRYIEPYSTVLPITHSSNFLHGHISNYLGADKPMIILENYEAFLDHFPLKWNYEKIPKLLVGNLRSDDSCIHWIQARDTTHRIIDYVCMITEKDKAIINSCENEINRELETNYDLLYTCESGRIKVYKKKSADLLIKPDASL